MFTWHAQIRPTMPMSGRAMGSSYLVCPGAWRVIGVPARAARRSALGALCCVLPIGLAK